MAGGQSNLTLATTWIKFHAMVPFGLMGITAGLAAVKTGTDLLKVISETLSKPDISPQEILARLIEVSSYMLEAKISLVDRPKVDSPAARHAVPLELSASQTRLPDRGLYWQASSIVVEALRVTA